MYTVEGIAADGALWLAGPEGRFRASLALPGCVPRLGDGAIAVRDAGGEAYVIGLLPLSRPSPSSPEEGAPRARATLTPSTAMPGEEGQPARLRLEPRALGPRGREASAPLAGGHLRLRAAEGVALRSSRSVRIESSERVDLCAGGGGAQLPRAQLALTPGALRAAAAHIEASSARAELWAQKATLRAERLRERVEQIRLDADARSLEAGRVIERAGEHLRELRGLAQERAGRARLLAEEIDFAGEEVLLLARSRMKIQGEQIHLL